jgi:hypothetical protein
MGGTCESGQPDGFVLDVDGSIGVRTENWPADASGQLRCFLGGSTPSSSTYGAGRLLPLTRLLRGAYAVVWHRRRISSTTDTLTGGPQGLQTSRATAHSWDLLGLKWPAVRRMSASGA